MPRRPRITSEYLHIIVRGIGKQILFEDPSDNEQYLRCLKKYAAQEEISVPAYCLMENRDEALALLKSKGLSVRQLERLTGINRGVIQEAKVVSENRPR